ncbi:MAG: PspC domain-containing protein [Bacteroidales bacterium]|jgi:phage shock protein PspC (stress-responsive transcriptional regulator)|nr:PspC domain-containing protein [Bacteroidales bacterium]
MEEVRQISLNGIVFFVEEDAYVALKKYINNLEKYYANKEDGKEIIEDIQIRFSELLLEKRTFQGQAMTLSNIEDVIFILGYPENFETEESGNYKSQNAQSSYRNKRLYRDSESAILGGVCGGLSYYFGIDAVIFRLIFIGLGIFSLGFWGFIYVVLWVIIPLARTTQQRYEMKGEALNIEEIEQKIKNGINEAEAKIKNFANNNADTIKNTSNKIYSVAKNICKFIIKIFGFCLLFASVCGIATLILTWFFPFSLFSQAGEGYSSFGVHGIFSFFGLNDIASLFCFITALLPLVLLFLLGIVLLITKIRKAMFFMILGIFILWIVMFIFVGLGIFSFIAERERSHITETVEISIPVSTQNIIVKPDKEIVSSETTKLQVNKWCLLIRHENNRNHFYGIANVNKDIIYTNDSNVVIRVSKRNVNDEQIHEFQKNIRIEDSIIYIPSLFQLKDNHWSGEKINIQFFVPRSKRFIIDDAFIRRHYGYYIDFD